MGFAYFCMIKKSCTIMSFNDWNQSLANDG